MTAEHITDATPRVFSIETVLACDLRCPQCAIGAGRIDSRPRRLLDFASFKHISDKIEPFAKFVYLHVWGEPLLNKQIFEMVTHVARFAGTNISTNAQRLTAGQARRLVGSGVSEIIVSIDGVSQATYEKYRVGGVLENALCGLALLQRERLRQGRQGNLRLIPQFIVFEHNEHEIEPFRQLCAELGLVAVFKAPYLAQPDPAIQVSSMPRYQRRTFASVEAQREAMRACPDPRGVFTILSDGSVVVCCNDANARTRFGNIFQQDVLQIWGSPQYRQFRQDIVRGQAPHFCLEHCLAYPRQRPQRARERAVPRLLRRLPTVGLGAPDSREPQYR